MVDRVIKLGKDFPRNKSITLQLTHSMYDDLMRFCDVNHVSSNVAIRGILAVFFEDFYAAGTPDQEVSDDE